MKKQRELQTGRKFNFLLSSATLAPLSMFRGTEGWVLNLAKKTGFDGVEFFLFGNWGDERVAKLFDKAKKLDMRVHFHQVWSVSESSDDHARSRSKIMRALGLLPSEGYKFTDSVPNNARPVIAYADRIDELSEVPDIWHQTISAFNIRGVSKLSWQNFAQKAKSLGTNLVLDTMHFLEYSLSIMGANNLPSEPKEIYKMLTDYWKVFGVNTREIHFNDYLPDIGDPGRNVFTGDGVVPLIKFSSIVIDSGWSGYIVPELAPASLFPYTLKSLIRLRQNMRMTWCE